MKLSFQHANPDAGSESFLIRCERESEHDQTACILVDAGPEVDLDAMLDSDEYLTAILLTHAHADHYLSLAENHRDGAPIYATEATASMLETVLTEAQRSAATDLGDPEAVLGALEPITEWASPLSGVRVAPVPVGHVPGAAGFVMQYEDDGGEQRTVLATGDWTPERAAGNPGLDGDLGVDVDALFLTGATNDCYTDALTESIGTIAKRAYAGSSVLVSASGLMGVRYAYLLSHLGERLDRRLSINLVGQAAKLYDDLGYNLRGVESIPEYEDPDALLGPETVTIAGPEVPTEGSSGRLFETIQNDESATLVQILGGGDPPIASARCTMYDFEVVAHPTEYAVDELVEELSPEQVVVTHQHGRSRDRYKNKNYHAFVWATDDRQAYPIFEAGEWSPPPWMTSEGIALVRNGGDPTQRNWFGTALESADAGLLLPTCERAEPDLAAEGLDVDALESRLSGPSGDVTSPDYETNESAESEPTPTEPAVSASTPEATTADEADPNADALTSIHDRLDAIESHLEPEEQTVEARVVDAGDGVTMLRLLDTEDGDVPDLKHGEEVAVTLRESAKAEVTSP
ncbi:MBL fold metallo-hydrolase [Halococcus hamelinensis]|uniref:Putative exonuclease of the beta-lactamase fold involved in RNA processing n=1 Tax=Halococcus hamelinensis 100A6 TaxID=1132509 RepID=M0M870_9EURY|nr:MBL fold metallo-hydrolase [Halococcus hamelinensis]EMA42002.1 putative exonuclease of the beta-lactamase fold involved in RNA processing [Halococcus hamelinensis 100A6]